VGVLKTGDTIGDWRVVAPLGRGGMGAVYRCRHALSERIEAAVKVLEPTSISGARERFIREAEALHALRHPAIVRIAGFGQDTKSDLLFLAMELVEGEDFDKLIARGAFPSARIGPIFAALADGLAYAHSRGVVHRDLKPANLMLQADGSPVLLDFGIAVQQGQDRLTQEGVVPGTVAYAAPEQVRGRGDQDPALCDLYALGQVLCECASGRYTFARDPEVSDHRRSVQILRAKLSIQPLDPGPEVEPAVRALVRSATAPEPEHRGPPLAAWSTALGGRAALPALRDAPAESEARDPDEATALLAAPRADVRASLPPDLALPTQDDLDLGSLRAIDGETLGDGTVTSTAVRRRRAVGVAAGTAAVIVGLGSVGLAVVLAIGVVLWFGALADEVVPVWPGDEPALAEPEFRLSDVLDFQDVDVAEIMSEAERREVVPPVSAPAAPAPARKVVSQALAGEARLVVAADIPAAVWINGVHERDSPAVFRLPAGRYEVELRPATGEPRRFAVLLRPDDHVRRIWSFPKSEWRSFDGGVDPTGLPARPPIADAEDRFLALAATRECLAEPWGPSAPSRFTLVVVPDGSVVADGLTGELRGTAFDDCLKAAARQLQFRPSVAGATATVSVPGR